jgi:hypothetical protein
MSISAAVMAAMCCAAAQRAGAIVVTTNGDFETGSFAGWNVGSTQVNPFQAALNDGKNVQIVNSTSGEPAWYLRNQPANYYGVPNVATPINNYSAFNGFDGSGGNYTLQQGFTVGAPLQSATLVFDWAVQSSYGGLFRTFDVNILDALNSPLTNVFSYARPQGNLPGWSITNTSLDITSALNTLGLGNYQVQFLVNIPQNFTGAAQFAIDNIALDLTEEPPVTTPEPASVVVWSLLGLSLSGTQLWRRRRTRRWAW